MGRLPFRLEDGGLRTEGACFWSGLGAVTLLLEQRSSSNFSKSRSGAVALPPFNAESVSTNNSNARLS